jgi:hypothetical protein
MLKAFILLPLVFLTFRAEAQIDHQLIRRMVVFPLKVDSTASVDAATTDEAWWQGRDELTKSRRFLIASKQFLVKSDVFQPRGDLEPGDAVILGKLLDAHALITLQLNGRRLTMAVYDGGNGLPLWRKSVSLHPSLTIGDQLTKIVKRIIDDFTASLPYQGFTVVDAMIGHPVYEEGDIQLAQADLGMSTGAQIGDLIQWVKVTGTTAAPLFQGGSKMTVYAEGKIVKLEQGIATVEILRATSIKDVREYSLVRVPREAERLQTLYTILDTPRTTLTPELAAPESSPMEQVAKERKPLASALSIVGSVAAFLLLAF